MLYRDMSADTPEIFLHSSLRNDVRHPYVYGVVIPYSSNLRTPRSSSKGIERLSFYSSFALNAANDMYKNKVFQKFVLFSDATFGEKRKSTGMLMKEALLRLHTTPRIQESDIVLFEANHLNNTPAQIKELSKYQLKNNLPAELFLIIDWQFHDERIRRYLRGFQVKADTVTVEEAHGHYNPKFQPEKLQQILPRAFEEREKKLRFLAHFDRRGFVPRCLKLLTGPVVTDIRKLRDFSEASSEKGKVHLNFENLSGKEKLRRLEGKKP